MEAIARTPSGRKEQLFAAYRNGSLEFPQLAERVYEIDHPKRRLRQVVKIVAGVVLPLLFVGSGRHRD